MRPTLTDELVVVKPTLAPCTVTLKDPVAAALERRIRLATLLSVEKLQVALPPRVPVVTSTRRLSPTPCSDWLLTDVSELHVVCSHAVWPDLAEAEYDVRPIFAPCTVTLAPPVTAVLPRRVTLRLPGDSERPFV